MADRRSGFTLIELLVVISIIGVLIALLMPAVMSSRESSRQTQCKSNMHNLGIALMSYHDSAKVFPPGVIYVDNTVGPWTSWATLILPMLDERLIYNAYNFGARMDAVANTTATGQVLRVFLCPSDVAESLAGGMGQISYAGCAGNGQDVSCGGSGPAACTHWAEARNGVLYCNSAVSVKQIQNRDGLTRTFLIGETCTRDTGAVTDFPQWPDGRDVVRTTYDTMQEWATYNVPGGPLLARSFRSLHPGGAHFIMCDGSVHFISASIDKGVFDALATMRGGEIVDDDSF